MPRLPGVDAKIKKRGGLLRIRTESKGGKYFHIGVTKGSGPRGGRTIALDAPRVPKKK